MSAGILGAIAGVGPGYMDRERMNIDKGDAKIRRERADRESKQFDWWQQQAEEWMKWRESLENPIEPLSYFDQSMNAAGALVNPQPTVAPTLPAPPSAPQNAVVRVPGMAEGGAVEVGPPEALPVQQMGPPASAAAPVQQPAPQRSWRDRYQEGYSRMGRLALLNGGLEGLQKFEEMENATARRQVLGYGLQAVQMLEEGNVGEAMRAGNAALERTPFDTGLQFVAQDGKLHIQGEDGSLGQALSAQDLASYVDDHMKTPENYLDWRQQYETERSALEREKIAEYQAKTARRQVDQYVAEGPSRIYGREAAAYGAIAGGRAALHRAYISSLPDAEGWSEADIRSMERDITDAIQKAGLGFSGPWAKESMADSPVFSMAAGYTKDIRRKNPPSIMSDDLAAAIVRTSLMNFVEGAKGEPLVKDARVGQDEDTGRWIVSIGNKEIILPEEVAISLNRNLAVNQQKLAAARQERSGR